MKLLETLKNHLQAMSINVLTRKASVSEELAQELHRSLIKNSKEGSCMRGLKIIFGHQI